MKIEIILIVFFLTTAIFVFADSYLRSHKKADLKEQQHDQSPENYKRF